MLQLTFSYKSLSDEDKALVRQTALDSLTPLLKHHQKHQAPGLLNIAVKPHGKAELEVTANLLSEQIKIGIVGESLKPSLRYCLKLLLQQFFDKQPYSPAQPNLQPVWQKLRHLEDARDASQAKEELHDLIIQLLPKIKAHIKDRLSYARKYKAIKADTLTSSDILHETVGRTIEYYQQKTLNQSLEQVMKQLADQTIAEISTQHQLQMQLETDYERLLAKEISAIQDQRYLIDADEELRLMEDLIEEYEPRSVS